MDRSTLRCWCAVILSACAVYPTRVVADASFTRGDVDSSSAVDLVDAVALLSYLFVSGAAAPPCLDAADLDDDATISIADAVALLSYLFVPGSLQPTLPFPACGGDPTPDSISCLDTNVCTSTTNWQQAPAMLAARGAHTSVTIGGKILLIGGGSDWSGGNTAEVQVYDPQTATWSAGTPVPDTSTWGATAEVVGGRVYLIGGWPAGGTLNRRYDPATDNWEYLAPSPINFRWGHASAVVADLIYVTGGVPAGLSQQVYDTATDTWSTAAPSLTISQRVRAESIGGLVYVLGTPDRKLQIYDPATNGWMFGPDLPVQAQVPATVVRNGTLWVLGGSTLDPNTGGNLSALQVYDPATQAWSLGESMPTCRSWATAVLLDDRVHVLGGLDSMNAARATHEVFD
ncbi:MAG: Kelch repeat-containing protein [Planctomycetota bacterium]